MGRRRRLIWIGGALAGAVALFVLVWFQPHKLFIEETVSEAPPTTRAQPADDLPATEEEADERPSEPSVLAEGAFQDLEHPTAGTARLLELSDGTRYLRFEDLDTSNGPDLRVYLSEIPASDDWHAYGERYVDLGGLKGNRGDQNYEVPAGTDLSSIKSAVIWCRRFTVGFGVAPLAAR
jgi:hypothetical protein